jgi:hypothetical protein
MRIALCRCECRCADARAKQAKKARQIVEVIMAVRHQKAIFSAHRN